MAPRRGETYFSLPTIPWILLIGTGLYLLFGSVFLPSMVPFDYLGPLGSLARLLKDDYPAVLMFLAVFTVGCHFVEALFCLQMCRKRNIVQSSQIKWFLSTMVFGGASLNMLSKFKQGTGASKLKK